MAKISDDKVLYNLKPAESGLRDASIIGNGRVWASLLGRKSNEEITINRADLSSGGYTGVLQDISDKFASVRKFYAEGKILDAEKVLSNEFAKKGYKPMPDKPLALATLCLDFHNDGFITDYRRTTDMEKGEVEVAFKHGNLTQTRSAFVSHQTDMVVYNAAGKVSVNISVKPFVGALLNPVVTFGGEYIYFAARSGAGVDYGFVARVVSGGIETKSDSIVIKNTDDVTIYIKTFNESNRDNEFKKLKAELSAVKAYDKVLSASASVQEKLFNSCELSLGESLTEKDFAALLESSSNGGIDTGLIVRLWNFGKYILICGANAADISFFNAAQLIYCGSMSDILQDIVLKFFESYEKYIDDLKKNAVRVYGMRGYFVPNVVSPKSALFGSADAGTIHFIASSALAANVFYKYYLTSGDVKTLKGRIFPFMKEVYNFYSDFLKLDSGGHYTTIPSYSPKSTPGNTIAGRPLENFGFAINSAIDFLAIDALLKNLIDAATVCGVSDGIAAWRDMRTKIPTFAVNDAGAIREYTNSAFIDRAQNLGTMHAYGLWPLKNISFNDKQVPYKPAVTGAAERNATIGLRKASFNALSARLSASWGFQDARSVLTCALQAAHSGVEEAPEFTREVLMRFLSSSLSVSGLAQNFDWRGSGYTHNSQSTFDSVSNIGFTNAITECIVQSDANNLRILPNIFGEIQSGKISDIVTDFAALVSVEWDIKKGKCIVKITPKLNCTINIEVAKDFRRIKSKDIKMDSSINGIKDFKLSANRSVTLEFV
jgi:hypothetical protein